MVKTAGSSEVRNSNTTDSFGENNCCLHCTLSTPVSIGEGCVLEYCDIGANAIIGDNCIISNVHLPEGTEVPPGTFLHTLTVMAVGRGALFVTVAFGIKDNLKKTSLVSELGKLKYFGSPLDVVMDVCKVFQVSLKPSKILTFYLTVYIFVSFLNLYIYCAYTICTQN